MNYLGYLTMTNYTHLRVNCRGVNIVDLGGPRIRRGVGQGQTRPIGWHPVLAGPRYHQAEQSAAGDEVR